MSQIFVRVHQHVFTTRLGLRASIIAWTQACLNET